MGWIIVIGFVVVGVGISYGIDALKRKGGNAALAAYGAQAAGRGAGWVLRSLFAVFVIVLGVRAIGMHDGPAGLRVGGVALAAYGIYVLLGGKVVFWD